MQCAAEPGKSVDADSGAGRIERLARLLAGALGTVEQNLAHLRRIGRQFRAALPEFCVEIMTGLFAFSQGERLDGTPLLDIKPSSPDLDSGSLL